MIKVCPKCGSTHVSHCGGDMNVCGSCNHVFYDRSGAKYRDEVVLTILFLLASACGVWMATG